MKSVRYASTPQMQQQMKKMQQSVSIHAQTKRDKSDFSFSSTMMTSKHQPESVMKKLMGTIDNNISFKFAKTFNDRYMLWRADSRPFNIIVGKKEGFKPRGKHTSIVTHVHGEPGLFVPFGVTQKASEKFIRGVPGWMYTTNFPELHLDVEETVGDEMESTEMFEQSFAATESEIVGIGEMPSNDIRMGRAVLKIPGTPISAFIGELKVNEEWLARNWTIQLHGVDPLEVAKRENATREKLKLNDDQRFIRYEEAIEIAAGIKKEFSDRIITPDTPVCVLGTVKASAGFSASVTYAMEKYYEHSKKHDVPRNVFVSFADVTSTAVETLYTAKDVANVLAASKLAKGQSTPVSSKMVSIEEVTVSEVTRIEGTQKHNGVASLLNTPETLPKGIVTRQSIFAKATTTVDVNNQAVTVTKDNCHKL